MVSYKDPQGIVDVVFAELKEQDKRHILGNAQTAEDMIQFHHGVGTDIRNRFCLWDQHNPHTDASDPNGDKHPDQVSHTILKAVWTKVKAEADR